MNLFTEPNALDPIYHRGNIAIEQASPILKDLWAMPSRCDVWEVLNKNNLTGSAAEVGVMYGHYMGAVIPKWKGAHYYAVDCWCRQPTDDYKEQQDTVDYESAYKGVMDFAARDLRVSVVKKMSLDAAGSFPDGSFDWVFIDANHSYRAVLEDMDAWWPKMKSGGLFSGHDYHYDVNWPNFIEVRPAVVRWMREHHIPFVASDSSWWSIKP